MQKRACLALTIDNLNLSSIPLNILIRRGGGGSLVSLIGTLKMFMDKLLREELQDVGYYKQYLLSMQKWKCLWSTTVDKSKFEQLREAEETHSVLSYKSHYLDRSEGAIALANESPNKSNYITMTSHPTFCLPSDPCQYEKGKILECLINHHVFNMY